MIVAERSISSVDLAAACEAIAYLREEADFNRSWIDGRRGKGVPPEYRARRREIAAERDRWADALEGLLPAVDNAAAQRPHHTDERLRG